MKSLGFSPFVDADELIEAVPLVLLVGVLVLICRMSLIIMDGFLLLRRLGTNAQAGRRAGWFLNF
jgi:hypothetical protein